MTRDESDILFEQYIVPESRRTHRDAVRSITKVNTKIPHVPLLFIAGLEDVIVPPVLIRKNIKKYKDKNSLVASKFFEGKDHFICGTPGWREVANFAFTWLSE